MRRVCLLFVLLAASCGRLSFDASDAANDGAVDAVPLGPWSEPRLILALSSPNDDSDPELRADGLELFFHSNRPGEGGFDLYRSVRASRDDVFGAPIPLTTVNTAGDEMGPALTADGLTLLFSDGEDIVYVKRPDLASDFGDRLPLLAMQTADFETTPEVSGDGLVAMVTRGLDTGREIWRYTRPSDGSIEVGWTNPVRVDEIVSTVTDSSPDLDLHALTVYLHSDRAGGFLDDIYIATRASTSEPFETPTLVPTINTSADEGDPTLTADQRTMVFHRALELYISTRQ